MSSQAEGDAPCLASVLRLLCLKLAHRPASVLPLQVDWLTDKMRQNNFTVSAMHGDMPQVRNGGAAGCCKLGLPFEA